jgi:ATP-binding cassette subfamily C exporter for protease/lipase
MMIAASILLGRALSPLEMLIGNWRQIVAARDAHKRLEQLLAVAPVPAERMALPAPAGKLAVEGVSVAAPGSQQALLRQVSFSAEPGELLAIIGPSGAGKSTAVRVLAGVWAPQVGKVRLDGADLASWPREHLAPHIGFLPQDVELFEGTVAENIARFGPVQPARVEAAARAVGMHEFILGLAEGYDSPIGDGGARLSGGQRQRLALARALYGQPVLVVLDEPNSSLDEEGNAALAHAIQSASALGTTFVVITHLGSALQLANKLLVLRDGRQQAFGPRAEVLAALAQAARPAPAQPACAAMQAAPA